MPHLPARCAAVILALAPLFVHRSRRPAQGLLIGAIPAPGRRTVASVLRITGRSGERRCVNHHRVLSRAAWCPRAGARMGQALQERAHLGVETQRQRPDRSKRVRHALSALCSRLSLCWPPASRPASGS